jgi:hypothetical protein
LFAPFQVPAVLRAEWHNPTVVRYDNESGKGDHRHLGKNERQRAYLFTTLEQLIMDFEADVIRLLGEKDESDH